MASVMTLVWHRLIPACNANALPADAATNAKLATTRKGLTLKSQAGTPTMSPDARILQIVDTSAPTVAGR